MADTVDIAIPVDAAAAAALADARTRAAGLFAAYNAERRSPAA